MSNDHTVSTVSLEDRERLMKLIDQGGASILITVKSANPSDLDKADIARSLNATKVEMAFAPVVMNAPNDEFSNIIAEKSKNTIGELMPEMMGMIISAILSEGVKGAENACCNCPSCKARKEQAENESKAETKH